MTRCVFSAPGRAPHALRCHDTGCRPSERVSHTVWTSSVCLHATVEHREHKYGSLLPLREGTGTSRSPAQQWHAARGMQNLAKQPKDDHATSLGQNRSAPCIRGRQCAPRRSGAAIRQHRGGIPLGSRSKCGVRPRAASAMVPRGGHRLNEPVVGRCWSCCCCRCCTPRAFEREGALFCDTVSRVNITVRIDPRVAEDGERWPCVCTRGTPQGGVQRVPVVLGNGVAHESVRFSVVSLQSLQG